MKFRVEVVCISDGGQEHRSDVLEIERRQLAMETLGLTLCESKAMLEGMQDFVVARQTAEDLEQRRRCPDCRNRYASKSGGKIEVKTLFGAVEVANPRWNRCSCQQGGPKSFRPTAAWLRGTTSPELLYVENKWASLIPFAKVADLLQEVLPADANHETIRRHVQATTERMEEELGEERQLNLFDGERVEQEEQPLPDGPITVGIDGGYVRAAHKEGFFEVIAGRSVVAFRRAADDEVPESKCFGYVQTYDEKPRRRLYELMKSQGLQDHQQVVFMSDGGEDVRRVQMYLHPSSEHWIDWFHITMRITVLQQQTKSLQGEANRAKEAAEFQADRQHEASALARQCRRGIGSNERHAAGFGIDPGSFGGGREAGGRPGRIRDLYPQQSGVHSKLWGALPSGRDDQHRVRRVDDQSRGESTVRQEAADAMDTEGRSSTAADSYEGLE